MIKFDEKYNPEEFQKFLEGFLPEDFVLDEKDILINDRYKIITRAKEVGSCKSLDLVVLEMEHSKEKDPRVAIATDAFKIMADHWVHNALVIFKNNDSENYRFSYLTIKLDLDEKNKVVRRYSNARRFSFYLGKDAKIKTPKLQLEKKGRIKDKNDLSERFSLEVVNKQFYLEVAKFFDEIVSRSEKKLILPSFSDDDLNAYKNFAVRLIGRIMFCWFLKQKKTVQGQLIPDEILSTRSVLENSNYYHAILEPLFFEVLNTEIEHRGIKSQFFDQVPYLNGGLFSPQADDFYKLDRITFFSVYINTLIIKDEWFENFFKLLETYNFTIDENTVFDQELSVDPEMLGRIFENLLAEINPVTGDNDRKRTGSFYTPRQIVEYMVDQSLLEFLKTKTQIDEKKIKALISYDLEDDLENPLNGADNLKIVQAIDSLRILDPACGSGAFPMGILQKIVYILQIVDPKCELWTNEKLKNVPELWKQKLKESYDSQPLDYTRKLDVIKNSIFGVDIQSIAVEVSRLRCFLTLVVESEIQDEKKNRGIETLPNLDFKFVCANSLISAPEETVKRGTALFEDDFQHRLAEAVDKYFNSNGENKRAANNEIHKLIDEKVSDKLKHLDSLVSYGGDEKMEKVRALMNKKTIEENSNIMSLWSSYKNIFEHKTVGFFDPKYFFPSIKNGFDIVIGNPPYVQVGKNIFAKTKFPYSEGKDKGKQNLYKVFIEHGYNLANNAGVVCFITQNSLMADISAEFTRELLLKKTCIRQVVEFPKASRDKNGRVFESVLQGTCIVLFQKQMPIAEQYFLVSSGNDKNSLNELNAGKILQEDILNFYPIGKYFPLINGVDFLVLKKIVIKKNRLKNLLSESSQGDFNLTLSKNEFSKTKTPVKMYRGKNVHRFCLDDEIEEYMKVGFKDDVIKNNQEHQYFLSQNITGTTDDYRLHFCLTNKSEKFLCGHSINKFRLSDENLNDIILGILNSKLLDWYFRKTSTNNHVNGYEIEELPIPTLNTSGQKNISNQIKLIVNQILILKKQNKDADTKNLESQIDQLVYQLYDLTEEEIKIIEK